MLGKIYERNEQNFLSKSFEYQTFGYYAEKADIDTFFISIAGHNTSSAKNYMKIKDDEGNAILVEIDQSWNYQDIDQEGNEIAIIWNEQDRVWQQERNDNIDILREED